MLEKEPIQDQGDTPKAQELAENRLLAAMRRWDRDMSNGMYVVDFGNAGFRDFVDNFGTNEAAAASRLVELYPRLARNTPQLAPHILPGVVSYQVDTNAAIISEFERSFAQIREHPEQISRRGYYAKLLSQPLYYWSEEHRLYGLGASLIEYRMKLAQQGKAEPLDTERKMSLAFSYLGAEQWQQALEVFETWSNRPVFMGNSGLIIAGKNWAWLCRRIQPNWFSANLVCRCTRRAHSPPMPTVFGSLLGEMCSGWTLDFKRTSVTASDVWIATAGAGLVQFDKTSHRCQHFTETEGLMMNYVNQVCLEGDTLWLGYGTDIGGGLGKLDLPSGKFTSFIRSLCGSGSSSGGNDSARPGSGSLPPRNAVGAVCVGPGDELWFSEGGRLRRYRGSDAWEEFPQAGPCWTFALSRNALFVGSYLLFQQPTEENTGFSGLTVLEPKSGKCRQVPALDGLPRRMVSAVAVDGASVWLGGMGFVALVDPQENKVLKCGYINARAVDRIQVAGGYLWVQFGQHLYRAVLN